MQQETEHISTAKDKAAKGIAKKEKIKKILISFLLLLTASACIAGAYIINRQKSIKIQSSLPGYICYIDNTNNTVITGLNNNLTLTLEEDKIVTNLRLNEKETKVFYIVRDSGKSLLCSRTLSSLIYDRVIISEDAASYALSRDGEKIAYLTSKGELFLADITCGQHSKISVFVSEFYLSADAGLTVYCAKDADSEQCIYTYSRGENKCIAKNAKLIGESKDLSYILAECNGILTRYDTQSGNSTVISSCFYELVKDYGDIIYFTSKDDNERLSLRCFDQSEKVISENFDEITYISDSPLIVYTKANDNGEPEYKLTVGADAQDTVTLAGNDLYNFMYSKQEGKLFYIDASRNQTMLISATLNEGTQPTFTAVDSEVYLLCGIISGKAVYLKNFNPITNMGDMYFNSTAIRRNISVNKYTGHPEYIRFVESFTSVFNGIVSELYACYPTCDLSAVAYCANGKLYSFDGRDEREIFMTELHNVYPLTSETLVIADDGKLSIISGGKLKKEFDTTRGFSYVKQFNE